MLSYQLVHVIETLEAELKDAMSKFAVFRETITQALTLSRQISNEWRWMERKRTKLPERKEFLENAMKKLSEALDQAEPEGEVRQILSAAYEEYRRLYSQIDRIVSSYETEHDTAFSNREEAKAALESLLAVMPRKIDELATIKDKAEKGLEEERIISALEQAIATAKSFKLNKEEKQIREELEKVKPVQEE
jgi:chromosome segregation ATPase